MKKLITTSIIAVLVSFVTTVFSQNYPEEYLGLPGDNLNLYAVMKLFRESKTLEDFERGLNDENSRINNLDLNGDNLIDYITVTDYVDGNVHTIVLRALLDRNESQDVAIFTVEKFRNGSVEIQLIGDEALYGRNYIIEPIYDETPNPGYMGNRASATNVTLVRTTTYQVATWPVIRFIFMPNYVVWRSSWYWGYYPVSWRPWRPYYWHYYYGYHYNWYHDYYVHYRFWSRPRYTNYNTYYISIRTQSPRVYSRIKEGSYRETYSRPEQRREGEILFTKMHPTQTRRTAENTPVVRNLNSSRERNGEVAKQGTPVQSRANVTTRERTTDRNIGTSTRTTTTARDRTQERTTSQNPGTTTRTTTARERTQERITSQNPGTTTRSTTATAERNRDLATDRNTGTATRSTTARDRTQERTTSQNPGTTTRTTTARERTQERTTSQNPGISTRSTTATAERNRDLATGRNTGTTARSTTTRVERERSTSAAQNKPSTKTTIAANPERSRNTQAPKASSKQSSSRIESRQNANTSSRVNSETRKR
jgi:hypothetical protein